MAKQSVTKQPVKNKRRHILFIVAVVVFLACVGALGYQARNQATNLKQLRACALHGGARLSHDRKTVACSDPMTGKTSFTTKALPAVEAAATPAVRMAFSDLPTDATTGKLGDAAVDIRTNWPSSECQPEAVLNVGKPIVMSTDHNFMMVPVECYTQHYWEYNDIFIYKPADGFWTDLGHLYFSYGCENIQLYNIPKSVSGNTCTDKYGIEHQVID